jgi:MYXO-CTERM domain-containing protein
MKKGTAAAAALVGIGLLAGGAAGDILVFDFEEFEGSENEENLDFLELTSIRDDVEMTLYRTSGVGFTIWNTEDLPLQMPDEWGSRHLSSLGDPSDDWFVAVFSRPMLSVSIEFGDLGGDLDDRIDLLAYSGEIDFGEMVDSTSGTWGDRILGVDPPGVMSVAGEESMPIDYVMFRGGSIDGGQPNSLFWDRMIVDTAPIPTPGALALLGVAALFIRRRRRG